MAYSLQVVFACEDPERMSEFWAGALGYVLQPPPAGFSSWEEFADKVGIPEDRRNDISAVIDPTGEGPRILFERWDGGSPNKRVHIDVNVMASQPGEIDDQGRRELLGSHRRRLEDLGATFYREAIGMAGEIWIEMYDPEGNWFCVQ